MLSNKAKIINNSN